IEFTYSGFTDLVKRIRNDTLGDIIIINNVSLANFNRISSEREKRGLGFRLSLYTADSGRLIVTIPTVVHEALHLFLKDTIRSINSIMGVPRGELLSTRATTFTNLDDAGGVRSQGEGDSSLCPRVCLRPNGFPTVVIEAGYTKSWDSLRQKARWWFAASHFDVKIVILAKFDPSSRGGRITIEKWKAVEAVLRPGVRTWAQANVPAQATCIQSIHITCRALGNDLEDPASYDVTDSLCLEFVDVYLRQPTGQLEGDSVIDIEELQAYAADFWLTNQ
ncbi:hypothetical protein F5887DRAFT_906941, partial [Amanita rubescens]